MSERKLNSRLSTVESLLSSSPVSDAPFVVANAGSRYGGYTLDYCIVGNQKVTIPERTTDFLQILFGSSPSASWVAAMPETQPSNGVVIDVTKNRLYFTGEFGNG